MKVLFLDIDGVVNCANTFNSMQGRFPLDPLLAFRVGKITLEVPELRVILSSSWRHSQEGIQEISKRIVPISGITPFINKPNRCRGDEIKAWLDAHADVTRYAILDDDNDMLPEQMTHFFKTEWSTGITEEIADEIISYFNCEHDCSSNCRRNGCNCDCGPQHI